MAAVREDEGVSVEVGTLELMAPGSAQALDRAAIDMQIATAKQYPRSIANAIKEATELATTDEVTAGSMFYVLPRRKGQDKDIQGPSARLAEIMLYSWGNARAEAAVVSEDGRFITAMGTCFDLERNVAVRITVRRRITNKHGHKFSEDMIGVTGNAAVSIAYRNVVLKVIPRSFTDRVYKAAQAASVGKGTLDQKRTAALEWFAKRGYEAEKVYALLDVKGYEDLGIDEIIRLRGVVNAIQDGDTTIEQIFNPQPEQTEGASKLDEALAGEKPSPASEASPAPRESEGLPLPAGDGDPEHEAAVQEAIKKVHRKGEKLAKAGALSMELSTEVDIAVGAKNLDALIRLDGLLNAMAKAHGVKL